MVCFFVGSFLFVVVVVVFSFSSLGIGLYGFKQNQHKCDAF